MHTAVGISVDSTVSVTVRTASPMHAKDNSTHEILDPRTRQRLLLILAAETCMLWFDLLSEFARKTACYKTLLMHKRLAKFFHHASYRPARDPAWILPC